VLRILDERRTNLTQQHTRRVNQLHALLRELLAGGAATDPTMHRAVATLARIRPGFDFGNEPVDRERDRVGWEVAIGLRAAGPRRGTDPFDALLRAAEPEGELGGAPRNPVARRRIPPRGSLLGFLSGRAQMLLNRC
jgi:hypothetical protein